MFEDHGTPAKVSVGAAYREGWTSPYLVIVHAIADDGSRLIASLNVSQDLGETLTITLNGEEIARAHGLDIFGLMKRYAIAQEFPADIRRRLSYGWASYVGIDMHNVAWWR